MSFPFDIDEPEMEVPTRGIRSPGRRYTDHVKQKGWWVFVIGCLLQGGFMTMSWKLMNMGERQLEAERDSAEKQNAAFRLQLAAQHRELIDAMKELAASNKEIAKATQEGIEELHLAKAKIKK